MTSPSKKPSAIPDGTPGAIVFTTLTREGMPLIRYCTEDRAAFKLGVCPCGTALRTLDAVQGRWHDRIVLERNAPLLIDHLDEAIFGVDGVLDDEAEIHPADDADHLMLFVAARGTENFPSLEKRIRRALVSLTAGRTARVAPAGGRHSAGPGSAGGFQGGRQASDSGFARKECLNMKTIADTACQLLDKGETFVLATIISHMGSTPRTSGSKMIVTAEGRGIGTIGGGLLEAGVMARAVELIPLGQSAVMPFDLSYETVASMDMICGGQAEVLLDCVSPNDANRAIFDAWRQVLATAGEGCFLTIVMAEGEAVDRMSHCLIRPGGEIQGTFPLTDFEREKIMAAAASPGVKTLAFDGAFVVVEPAVRVYAAHFFGAGHVARPTAHLAALVGFQVNVYDDRREFANRERFPDAHAIHVLETFDRAFDGPALGTDDFVVILTRGHLHDQNVLARALSTRAGYIGMIGSRKKRNTIYRNLRDQGVTQQDIDRVHSPIGLAIGAETPEEIAVSIVAELIGVRAETIS